MSRLVAEHASPTAGGVETLIAISESTDPVPAKRIEIRIQDGLMWAGVATLLGSRRPVLWAGVGILASILISSKAKSTTPVQLPATTPPIRVPTPEY